MTALLPAPSATATPTATTDGPGRWVSRHLHVPSADPQALEDVVTSVVAPAVVELARAHGPRPWFFMRYWQRGPHVRLRVADLDAGAVDALDDTLARRLAGCPAPGDPLTPDAYAAQSAGIAAAGEGDGSLDQGTLLPGGVHPAVYEAEVRRYGGPDLMATSERLFASSSVVCLRACLTRDGHGRNIADGLEAMAATVSAWPGDPLDVLRHVHRSWLAWLEQAYPAVVPTVDAFARRRAAALASSRPLVTALVDGSPSRWTPWTSELAPAARTWVEQLGERRALEVFVSQLHMTQNRLGVGGGREAHLSAALLALLDDPLR